MNVIFHSQQAAGNLTQEIKMRYLLANLPTVIGLFITIYICSWLWKIYKYTSIKRRIRRLILKCSPQQKETLSNCQLTELEKIIMEGKFYDPEAMETCVKIYIRQKTPQ